MTGWKFDPARAARLDSPERERYLPTERLIDLLDLSGGETVVDYGAGTGRLTIAAAGRLGSPGRVIAVEENAEMFAHLRRNVAEASAAPGGSKPAVARMDPLKIEANSVPLPDGCADRIIAVNLLHEVRGEQALGEMRRLIKPDGLLLAADWQRGHEEERPGGPPEELLYSAGEAVAEVARAGFVAEPAGASLPYHFVLLARPGAGPVGGASVDADPSRER